LAGGEPLLLMALTRLKTLQRIPALGAALQMEASLVMSNLLLTASIIYNQRPLPWLNFVTWLSAYG
jgi:hypothetical protein